MITLEKVARAICRASICDVDTISPEDLPTFIHQWWPEHLPAARAALEAMKYEDGADEDRLVAASNQYRVEAVSLSQAWDHMIQAALDEKSDEDTTS